MGWKAITTVRTTGKSAGSNDTLYISPNGKTKCRSLVEVERYITKQSKIVPRVPNHLLKFRKIVWVNFKSKSKPFNWFPAVEWINTPNKVPVFIYPPVGTKMPRQVDHNTLKSMVPYTLENVEQYAGANVDKYTKELKGYLVVAAQIMKGESHGGLVEHVEDGAAAAVESSSASVGASVDASVGASVGASSSSSSSSSSSFSSSSSSSLMSMLTQNAKASPKRKREEEPQQEIVVVGDKADEVETAVVPRVKKLAKKAMVNDVTKEAKASKESP